MTTDNLIVIYKDIDGQDAELEHALVTKGVVYSTFFYSVNEGGGLSTMDKIDEAGWPKLYRNYEFVVSGVDGIKADLDL